MNLLERTVRLEIIYNSFEQNSIVSKPMYNTRTQALPNKFFWKLIYAYSKVLRGDDSDRYL